MVKVDAKARIVSGKYTGWFIWVQDDRPDSGGYLVIQSSDIEFRGDGFDNWFISIEEVEKFFVNNNWRLEWLD